MHQQIARAPAHACANTARDGAALSTTASGLCSGAAALHCAAHVRAGVSDQVSHKAVQCQYAALFLPVQHV